MKLIELKIEKIRGIKSILLKPDGNNLVIWGPNGSGKSAVVDAIDFLLTGRILRLTGKGTKGITLGKHGPHIDCESEDAIVCAKIQIPNLSDPVEIKRCMAHPNVLECDDAIKPHLEPIMILAQQGQHVLTRREILKYIASEPSTRAGQIQELLNISEIEEIRKALVKAHHEFEKELQSMSYSIETAKCAINSTLQRDDFREDKILEIINKNRLILGGQPVESISLKNIKLNLTLPATISGDRPVNVALFDRDITNIHGALLEEAQSKISTLDTQLRALIASITSNSTLLRALNLQELTELGIKMIDQGGSCPLCDTIWPAGELKKKLEERLRNAQTAVEYKEKIDQLAGDIAANANIISASLRKVIVITQIEDLKNETSTLKLWLGNIEKLVSDLNTPLEKYLDTSFTEEQVKRMLAPNDAGKLLDRVQLTVKAKYPEATPEQIAWDTLTRLEENLKALDEATNKFTAAQLYEKRANTLLESFLQARDCVLGKLYEDIQERFKYLYQQLHGADESEFDAKLEPDGAGLNFEVDFYGRGTFPPNALHSEGHQDSMGLCLYLALAEWLNRGLINIFILDDVVMSVDADHRRELCHMLATSFPDKQFLITTHDRTWMNQLKAEGVAGPRGFVEFYNWCVDTGPLVNHETDLWEKIEYDLNRNDISGAAHRLRRGSEQFFEEVCDALQANVKYKMSHRWELGDFLFAAMSKYKELLRQAEKCTLSWGDNKSAMALKEQDSIRESIFKRSNAEQWAINPAVHYNRWADLSGKDFRPVVEAFHDLFDLFICSNCKSLLRLAVTGTKSASVRCNCGKVNWNLIAKNRRTIKIIA